MQSESERGARGAAGGVIQVASFSIDLEKRLLWRDGDRVPLTAKAFDVLEYLVRHPGRLLDKQEILDAVWGDTHVEEGNLARTISSLRKALGERPEEHRFIVTVAGQGYRFVGNARQSARDPKLEVEDAGGEQTSESPPVASTRERGSTRRWIAAAALLGSIGLVLGLRLDTGPNASSPRPARLSIPLPEPAHVRLHDTHVSRIAIAPDGQRVVVAVGGGNPLWARTLDDLELAPLEGTEGGTQPFFSPDGLWVGFFTLDGALRKVPAGGGGPLDVVTGLAGARWSSGVWLEGGDIVFAPDAGGLFRVSADGGGIERVPAPEGRVFATPAAVPGTDLVLLTERTVSPHRIVWLDLGTGESGVVCERAWNPMVTASGQLLFTRDRTVLASQLAQDGRSLSGPIVPVPEAIAFDHPMVVSSQAQLAVSTEGTLAYLRPLGDQDLAEELVWIDRGTGRQESVGTLAAEGCIALSRDGSRLLTTGLQKDELAVSMVDLQRGVETRLVEAPAVVTGPAIWIPGTEDFLYPETTPGVGRILRASSDGTRPPEIVLEEEVTLAITPWSVSSEGVLAYTVFSNQTSGDVRFHSLTTGERLPVHFLETAADERQPAFSPDGRWIAYDSNELEGRFDVFVRRFPSGAGKQRVSLAPFCIAPRWSTDGSELFFQQWGGTFFAVSVSGEETLTIGAPETLFRIHARSGMDLGPKYAVSPDARRVLLPLPNLAVVRAAEIVVVQNWLDELKRLAPAD